MTVEIPVELQQFVHSAIDAGSYKDEAEVTRVIHAARDVGSQF